VRWETAGGARGQETQLLPYELTAWQEASG